MLGTSSAAAFLLKSAAASRASWACPAVEPKPFLKHDGSFRFLFHCPYIPYNPCSFHSRLCGLGRGVRNVSVAVGQWWVEGCAVDHPYCIGNNDSFDACKINPGDHKRNCEPAMESPKQSSPNALSSEAHNPDFCSTP